MELKGRQATHRLYRLRDSIVEHEADIEASLNNGHYRTDPNSALGALRFLLRTNKSLRQEVRRLERENDGLKENR